MYLFGGASNRQPLSEFSGDLGAGTLGIDITATGFALRLFEWADIKNDLVTMNPGQHVETGIHVLVGHIAANEAAAPAEPAAAGGEVGYGFAGLDVARSTLGNTQRVDRVVGQATARAERVAGGAAAAGAQMYVAAACCVSGAADTDIGIAVLVLDTAAHRQGAQVAVVTLEHRYLQEPGCNIQLADHLSDLLEVFRRGANKNLETLTGNRIVGAEHGFYDGDDFFCRAVLQLNGFYGIRPRSSGKQTETQ